MLKKYTSIVLTLALVGAATVASASEIKLSGDARWRGAWLINKDFNNDNGTPQNDRLMDERIRIVVDAKNDDGAQALVRLKAQNALAEYGQIGTDNQRATALTCDWAYVKVPVGPGTLTVGRQPADWGNKLLVWDNNRDRAKYTATFGNTTVGVLWDKFSEDSNGANGVIDENVALRDKDAYAALAIQKFGESQAGVIAIYAEDDRRTVVTGPSTTSTTAFGQTIPRDLNTNDSHKVWYLDGFWNIKAGAAAINGEAVYVNNAGRKPNVGFFTDVNVAAGPATIKGVIAHSAGGFVADDDFIPLNMIGTDNPWAVMNFGGVVGKGAFTAPTSTTDSTGSVGEGRTQTLIGVSALVKASDKVLVNVDGGYLYDTLQHNAWTASAAAVYLIGKNTNWTVLAGYWDGDEGGKYSAYSHGGSNGDPYIALCQKLEFTF